jgi:hypothetical protein
VSEIHAAQIADWIGEELYRKYLRGQKEHGGNVARKNVRKHITEEAIDLIVYLAVLQEQLATIEAICRKIDDPYEQVQMVLNICQYGNKEGDLEEEKTGSAEAKEFGEFYYERVKENLRNG